MFEPVKKEIQSFFAARKKGKPHTMGEIKNLKDVTSLALFFCINSKEELLDIRKLVTQLKKPGRPIMAFVFYPGYQTLDLVTDKSIFFFNLNDFTLFAKMRENLEEKIRGNSYELMIGFVLTPEAFCTYLLQEINASFKIGMQHPELDMIYNMTIKTEQENMQVLDFYKQVKHYLEVLNIESK